MHNKLTQLTVKAIVLDEFLYISLLVYICVLAFDLGLLFGFIWILI